MNMKEFNGNYFRKIKYYLNIGCLLFSRENKQIKIFLERL